MRLDKCGFAVFKITDEAVGRPQINADYHNNPIFKMKIRIITDFGGKMGYFKSLNHVPKLYRQINHCPKYTQDSTGDK